MVKKPASKARARRSARWGIGAAPATRGEPILSLSRRVSFLSDTHLPLFVVAVRVPVPALVGVVAVRGCGGRGAAARGGVTARKSVGGRVLQSFGETVSARGEGVFP